MATENTRDNAGTDEAVAAKEILDEMLKTYPAKTLGNNCRGLRVRPPG
jgi:hypothetical protein